MNQPGVYMDPVDIPEVPIVTSEGAAASLSMSDLDAPNPVAPPNPMVEEDDTAVPIASANASASLSMADVDSSVLTRSLQQDDISNKVNNNKLEEGEQHPHSLPPAEEVRAAVNPGRQGRSKRKCATLLCIALLVVVMVLGVALGVGLTMTAGSESDNDAEYSSNVRENNPYIPGSPSSSSSGTGNIAQDIVEEMDRFQKTMFWLEREGISDTAKVKSVGSPQYKAARWIAEEDQAKLAIPRGSINDFDDSEGYMFMFRYVMAVLYYQMNGENWHFPVNWLSKDDVCDWTGRYYALNRYSDYEIGGIRCDDETRLPIELDLELQNLEGPVPVELGLLDTLITVDLEFNEGLNTQIPEALCDLPDLGFLGLRGTQLVGEIPTCFGKLSWLQILDIRDNNLEGRLPEGMCDQTSLRQITLDRNQFEGPLPDCIGQWTDMMVLGLSDNRFDGELPAGLSKLAKLKSIYLDGNDFRGDPATILNELTSLHAVMIEDNQFEGVIDENFLKDLEQLVVIDVSTNLFTFTDDGIPTHLFEMPNLQILDLAENNFASTFPDEIPFNDGITFLSLHENSMRGTLPSQIKNLTALQHLDLSNNNFEGPIHKEFFEIFSLRHIFISENPGLDQGPIPVELEAMSQLTELSLKNSNRNGTLPELLGFLELWILDLDNNDFSGGIPSNFGKLPMLRHLLLNRNPKLSGELPVFDQTLNLGTVLLDGTDLTGDFSTICELPTFQGQKNISTDVIMIADCGGDDSTIQCDCCHCCDKPFCSDPLVASLDWTWEYGFFRAVRDFALNISGLEGPAMPSVGMSP